MQRQGLILALSFGAILLSALAATARDRALVVGINEYPGIISDGKAGGRNLVGAVPDARTFVSLLTDVLKFDPADVKLLTDDQATKAKILGNFQEWLTDATGPGDRVVFYYSGHGATAAVDEGAGRKRLTSTIVPSDASGNLDKPGSPVLGMIDGKTIGSLVAKLNGRIVMVVADSCQSGSVTRSLTGAGAAGARARTISEHVPVGMSVNDVTRAVEVEAKTDNRLLHASSLTGPRELDVWTAATIAQVTFDLRDGSGGIFTQSFAQGLRDKQAAHAPLSEITAGNLLQFVRDKAAAFCKAEPGCKAGLTPELQAPADYLTRVLNPLPVAQPAAAEGIATPSPSAVSDDATAAPQPAGTPAPLPSVAVEAPTPAPIASTDATASTPTDAQTPAPQAAEAAPPTGAPGIVSDVTNLFAHHNDFALSAEILPSARVRQGAAVKFRVTSDEPGTLLIIDVGPDGKPTQIFPNARSEQLHKAGNIRRGAPITIPDASYGFAFTATHPGPGKLLVLVAEEGLDLSQVLSRNLDFKPMSNARSIVVEIANKLDEPKISPDPALPNGSHRFAFVAVPYEVLP